MNIMIISENAYNEIIIQKSKFITYLYKVNNKEKFLEYYELLKKQYKDASHICYAYIINQEIKYSDDNEPNGTAGLPIYEVLKKNNLNYIACFIIRYFGGIKLGTKGLLRAYSNSVSLALKNINIVSIEPSFKIKVQIDYSKVSILENIIDKKNILESSFQDYIIYKLIVNKDILNKLELNKISYIILEENNF